jgi:hypothetical protein
VARDVEHEAAPGEARAVGNRHVRRATAARQTAQRLLGVEAARVGLGLDPRLAVADGQPVALVAERRAGAKPRGSRDHASSPLPGPRPD